MLSGQRRDDCVHETKQIEGRNFVEVWLLAMLVFISRVHVSLQELTWILADVISRVGSIDIACEF
jgi:hypothetical protein